MPSSLLPNDGQTLWPDITNVGSNDLLLVCTLQGTVVMVSRERKVDIRRLPEGMYELKSITVKGFSHRLGFFAVKRNKKTANTWRR